MRLRKTSAQFTTTAEEQEFLKRLSVLPDNTARRQLVADEKREIDLRFIRMILAEGLRYSRQSDFKRTAELDRLALVLAEETKNIPGQASSWFSLGRNLLDQGNYREARDAQLRGLEFTRQGGDPDRTANALNNVTLTERRLGRL